MAKDPVCNMEVNEETAQYQLEYHGTIYYFCTQLCMLTFKNDPEKHLQRQQGNGADKSSASS